MVIKTILVSQKGMKLDLSIRQTFIEFLPTRWPPFPLHQAGGLVGIQTNKHVITTEQGMCMTDRWRRFQEHAEGRPPPDLGDRRSFPEVRLVENSRNYMPSEGNIHAKPPKHQVESIQIVYPSENQLLDPDVTNDYLTTAPT